ncbi:hypothetical protein BB558_004780 [Smittium angustum]|uniref:Major facilitator superfamily (MFS) profile domain-containing protein n=1 Tax=Smittium angustum TaxID=133377 RepID=A0A2U1J2H9_SMIAN|nr:hypothetical protein BB558_004780 [Smittium angustum]
MKTFEFFVSKKALVALVAVSLFIDVAVYGIVTPALPDIFQRDLKASTSVNGIFVAFYGLGVLIGSPTVSYFSDRTGKRRMPMIIGFFVLGFSSIAIGLSKELYQIFLARLGQGIASGITWSLGLAMLIDIYPPDKLDSPISLAYSGFTIGLLSGPFIGGVVYQHSGKMGISYLMMGIALINMIFRFFVPDSDELHERLVAKGQLESTKINQETPSDLENRHIDNGGDVLETDSKKVQSSASDENKSNGVEKNEKEPTKDVVNNGGTSIGFLHLIKEHRVLVCCIITIISYGAMGSLGIVLPIYYSDKYGLNPAKIGYTFIAFSVPSVFGGLIFGKVTESKKMTNLFGPNKKRYVVMLGGNLLMGAFIIFLGLTKSITLAIVFMCLIGFCVGSGNVPVMSALGAHMGLMTQRMIEEGKVPNSGAKGGANSQVYSLYNIAYSFAVLVIPILSGIILKSSGFFLVCLFLGLLVLIGSILSAGSVLMFSKGR